MFIRWCRLLLAGLLLASCSAAEPPALPRLELKHLMEHVIDPAADVFWESSGIVVTAEGEKSRAPTTDAGWQAAVNAAALLVESGNLLMLPGRARGEGADRAQWQAFAKQLADASVAGMKAAQAKNEQGVFDTGGQIYNACRACHMKFVLGQ